MRFRTIWTIPAMSLRERLRRSRDWAAAAIAHRLPRRIAYWSFIDTGVRAIKNDEVVPEVTYMALLERAGEGIDSA